MVLPLLPLLGYLFAGAAVGAAVGGIIGLLSDDDVKDEARNHTGGYDLSNQYSEIKRINKEKGKGYYDIGLGQYMKSDNRLIDSWSMKAESVGNMYVGKRLYYD